jgi:hypothetical protein
VQNEQPVAAGTWVAGQPAVDDRIDSTVRRSGKNCGFAVAPVSSRRALEAPKSRNMNGAS